MNTILYSLYRLIDVIIIKYNTVYTYIFNIS